MSEFKITFITSKKEKISTCWVKANSWTIEGIQLLTKSIENQKYYFEFR